MASQLRELIGNLEERVSERTQALERRSMQLQVAAEVARDVISADNLFQLLNQAVNLIRNRFDFYHAGIFLVDDQSEFAVLQAATGEAGRNMLEQGHKLKIGSQGIVGTAISTGKAHIALDVGTDAVHFKNRLLPLTRSEIALPLRSGERVIGALDVQSQRPAAFDEDDITVLQTLADQLAIAIENTRLLQRMDQTVRELQQAYGTYTQETWKVYSQKMQKPLGYRFQQIDVFPVEEQRPEARQALLQGETVLQRVQGDAQEGTLSVLAVPIKLRNEVIGVLSLRFEGDDVPAETVALVEEAATRLGLVVENVRLLESAQNMAFREQQVNLISNQLRGSANVETVLQNTVRELGKALGVSRTFIALSSGWSEQATKQGNKPGRNHEKSLRPASGNGSKGNGKSREQ
jgi:GAF domain-containing protein